MRNGSPHPNARRASGTAAAPARQRSPKEQRQTRVEELRAQYLAGNYQVDSLELSRKIVDAHLAK